MIFILKPYAELVFQIIDSFSRLAEGARIVCFHPLV